MFTCMRLITRQDAVLAAGLIAATLVIFTSSIRHALDFARQIEDAYGLALVPALVILTVVFIFHQQAKRQEMKSAAAAAAAEARQAQDRARELERIVMLGQSLARALDHQALREAIWRHLPDAAGRPDLWILMRAGNRWESLMGATRGSLQQVDTDLEALADAIVTDARAEAAAPGQVVERNGRACLPLFAGDVVVGVMGVAPGPPLPPAARRALSASAALLAIAIRNVQLFHEVREHGLRDGLTGCFHKAYALELIDAELRRARRSRGPLSLIMFDLDHFKAINDRHGHLCGDAVLAAVGSRMRELLRSTDIKCRYGGEEFLVLLPETPIDGAAQVAEWLRRELADLSVAFGGRTIPVTASFGVTAAQVDETDAGALIARADAALYRAKHEGRNCVRSDSGRPRRTPDSASAGSARSSLRLVAAPSA